jgi:phosphoglycolate phosphatase-like HAD superfamily hydrolase
MILGWDIDWTLCRSYMQPHLWLDESALRLRCLPRHVALERFKALDAEHVFITGRSEPVRAITEAQVRQWTGVEDPVVYMQESWQGHDALRDHKARALREAGCQVYVGDAAGDLLAAQDAQVRFLWAGSFEKWGLPQSLREVVA